MANPNIVNVTTIQGKVAGAAVTTSATALVSNSSSSGKIIKLNALSIANISASTATITVDIYKGQSTAYRLAYTIAVPSAATSATGVEITNAQGQAITSSSNAL